MSYEFPKDKPIVLPSPAYPTPPKGPGHNDPGPTPPPPDYEKMADDGRERDEKEREEHSKEFDRERGEEREREDDKSGGISGRYRRERRELAGRCAGSPWDARPIEAAPKVGVIGRALGSIASLFRGKREPWPTPAAVSGKRGAK